MDRTWLCSSWHGLTSPCSGASPECLCCKCPTTPACMSPAHGLVSPCHTKITRGRLEPAPRNSALQGPGLRRPKGPEIISCAAARQRIRNTLTLRMNWLCRRGPKAAAGDSKWNHLKGDRSRLLLGGLLLALLLCSFLLSHDQVLLEQKRCLRVSSGFGAPKNLQSLRGVSEQTAHPLEQSCITIQ